MKRFKGYIWMVYHFGFRGLYTYERARKQSEKCAGETYNPKKHGVRLLRAIGATDFQIHEAKQRGLA